MPHLSAIGAADFVQVDKILWSSGILFGLHQMELSQKVDRHAPAGGCGALLPGDIKIGDVGNVVRKSI